MLFFLGEWNAKVGSQEILGITGKFDPGVQNAAGQRLTEFCKENAPVIANTLFHKRRLNTWTAPDLVFTDCIGLLHFWLHFYLGLVIKNAIQF